MIWYIEEAEGMMVSTTSLHLHQVFLLSFPFYYKPSVVFLLDWISPGIQYFHACTTTRFACFTWTYVCVLQYLAPLYTTPCVPKD